MKARVAMLIVFVGLGIAGVALAATGSGQNFSVTPSMSLYQPTPGVCGGLGVEPAGKDWLSLINASFTTIDRHNHSPGYGQPVPAAGLNINADLPFGGYNATGLRSARFGAIATTSLGASDLAAIFVSGTDLYFVDGSGNVVRITSGGGLAGAPGSIGGLVSPAAATYTPASKLFSFTSASGFAANLSSGPLSIGDATLSAGKAATVSVPAGLASSYSLTLPAALPASTQPLVLSSTGQITPVANLSLGGTLGVTGATTLGGVLTASAGITTNGAIAPFSTGDVMVSRSGTPTTGAVFFGNTGAKYLYFDGSNWALGNSATNGRLAGLSDPSNAQDAATKNYVDGKFPVTWQTAGTGNTFNYTKDSSGFVHLRGGFFNPGAAPVVVYTLPVGFRPGYGRWFVGVNNPSASPSPFVILVNSDGTITLYGTMSSGWNWVDGVTFYAEQ